MLPHAPFSRAVDAQSGRINHDMPWATLRKSRHGNLERTLAATHRAVVRNGQGEPHQLYHRGEEALRRTQTEVIDGFEDQGTFDGQIRIETRCTRPCGRFCVTLPCDRLFVEPHGEAATVDQRTVVLTPVTDTVTKHRRRFWHAPS